MSVPPNNQAEPRRLYRSRNDRMIFGVAGGFARYFHVDPAIFRIVFVGVVIFTAIIPGLLFYILCAIIIPEEPAGA